MASKKIIFKHYFWLSIKPALYIGWQLDPRNYISTKQLSLHLSVTLLVDKTKQTNFYFTFVQFKLSSNFEFQICQMPKDWKTTQAEMQKLSSMRRRLKDEENILVDLLVIFWHSYDCLISIKEKYKYPKKRWFYNVRTRHVVNLDLNPILVTSKKTYRLVLILANFTFVTVP